MKQLLIKIADSVYILLCLASTASAEQARPYFTLLGGFNLTDEIVLSDQTGDYIASVEPGFFAGGALGYDLGDAFPQLGKGRLELEFGYRYNLLKEAHFSTGTVYAEGDLSTISVMFNAIGEYENYSPYYVPYIGIGLGAATVSMIETSAAGSPMIDDSDTRFAYQVLTGLTFPVSGNLVMDLGYRYFGTLKPEFIDSQNQQVEVDYANHSFELGLRLGF